MVIPIYECEPFLQELYQRLVNSIEPITTIFEIIMVEDYGKDHSWEIIENLCKLDKQVKGIRFNRNFGQHYAITAGLDYCIGKWAIVMDADLQDRPEEIVKLYDKAQEGYDVVLAIKAKRNYPIIQSVTS